MNIKTIVLSLITIFFFSLSHAQNEIIISYNSLSELHVNNIPIVEETSIDIILEQIGKPSKIEEFTTGEKSYFYEKQGVVFVAKNEVVKGVGVNYHWDGDKKFTETSFTGKLTVGELEIDKETTSENISGIRSLSFLCPSALFCSSKDESVQIKAIVGFNKDAQITQIAFFMESYFFQLNCLYYE